MDFARALRSVQEPLPGMNKLIKKLVNLTHDFLQSHLLSEVFVRNSSVIQV